MKEESGSAPRPNVHKDFHGALSYGLQFVDDNYGAGELRDFLSGLANTVYRTLVDDLRARGLVALHEHWQRVFEWEEGEFSIRMDNETLVLTVHRCPAVTHMQENGYAVAKHFCEHTRIVNEAICAAAGYTCSVDYRQDAGRCVQRFCKATG